MSFLKKEKNSSDVLTKAVLFFPFQEAILRLSGVVTYEQLEDAVKEALEAALPNVVSYKASLS